MPATLPSPVRAAAATATGGPGVPRRSPLVAFRTAPDPGVSRSGRGVAGLLAAGMVIVVLRVVVGSGAGCRAGGGYADFVVGAAAVVKGVVGVQYGHGHQLLDPGAGMARRPVGCARRWAA